jgi:hypothetical protein
VACVEFEGDAVKPRVVVGYAPSMPPWERPEPVGELVEEREPLIQLIGPSRDRDAAGHPSRDTG